MNQQHSPEQSNFEDVTMQPLADVVPMDDYRAEPSEHQRDALALELESAQQQLAAVKAEFGITPDNQFGVWDHLANHEVQQGSAALDAAQAEVDRLSAAVSANKGSKNAGAA